MPTKKMKEFKARNKEAAKEKGTKWDPKFASYQRKSAKMVADFNKKKAAKKKGK